VTNLVYLAKTDLADSSKAVAYLSLASRELERVAHITRQTLGFYRETLSPVRFSITQAIDDLLPLYERRFESRNVKVIKQYRGKMEITALVGEVRQALSNLITNAIDAMPNGGSLVIRVSRAHEWNKSAMAGVRITIMDTGSGIAPQYRKHLFQPFFTTKEDVGTGLGLWITRNIVEKHHGMVRVKSRTGEDRPGTVFSIFLPQEIKLGSAKVSPAEAA
jgi:signal transduction histidine kinase